ncbi:MAG: hypothetical protein L0212_02945 [Acidobacteria bacterium]|nr:hypothetical protein [Acidobacteriota bacterium]
MAGRAKLWGALILAGVVAALASSAPAQEQTPATRPPSERLGLFHPNPEHLWNRLHRHFTVRTSASGEEYGFDALDPLLWYQTEYLLAGESHEKALRLCDEFLQVRGERLIGDPVKRALLQRDLWAVFDWSADRRDNHPAARAALRARLGAVLWRLALPEEQIRILPDNYRQAIASARYGTAYDPLQPRKAFLPPDLFDPRGPWVALNRFDGPTARSHVGSFSGRSVFHVFLRLPGGRKATLEYLEKLWRFPRPWVHSSDAFRSHCCTSVLKPEVPQFPQGTQVALARRLVLFDSDGKLMATSMTESIQIRVYREVPVGVPFAFEAQDFLEFTLNRALLLAGEGGGLRPITQEETAFPVFSTHGFDVFEQGLEEGKRAAGFTCGQCHAESGIHSVRTLEVLLPPQPLHSDPVENDPQYGPLYWEASAVLSWKENRYDWGLLNALKPLTPESPKP